MKILIVEDEIAYQKLLEEFLKSSGYQVITAGDGKKGLAIAITQQPDLILLDVRLPEMDGMQVLSELRKDAYGKTAKVILLTNLEPNDAMIKNVITDKPAYYFVKSNIDLEELEKKIRALLPS